MTAPNRFELQLSAAILALGVAAGCTSGEQPSFQTAHQSLLDTPSALFISEVMSMPGVSYVELYNAGASTIDLNGYRLVKYENGSRAGTCQGNDTGQSRPGSALSETPLRETIAPGTTKVIVNLAQSQNFARLFSAPFITADSASGDGGDAYELLDNRGVALDAFGEVGVDPADPPTAPWYYANKVARRKYVRGGLPIFSASEWSLATVAGDGSPGTPGVHVNASAFISEIAFHSGADPLSRLKWVELYNPTEGDIDLGSYTFRRYRHGSPDPINSSGFPGITIASGGKVVMVKASGNEHFERAYGGQHADLIGQVNGNGEDAFELMDGDFRVDMYGVIGSNGPSNPWVFDTGSAQRRPGYARGNSVFDVGEWNIRPDFDGDPHHHTVGTAVYISEVADHPTESTLQWIELCNPTSSPIDLHLGHYKLKRYRDDSLVADPPNGQDLAGIIEPGRTFVIVRNNLGEEAFQREFGFARDLPSSVLSGINNTFELLRDETPIDIYGVIGVDPDTDNIPTPDDKPWAYRRSSAERKATTLDGQTVFSRRDQNFPNQSQNYEDYFKANWTVTEGKGTPGSHACGSRSYAPVPATAQTQCYNSANGDFADDQCTLPAAAGQDGKLRKGIKYPNPRFRDNGDGTVTDLLTGVTWLKKAHCLVDPAPRLAVAPASPNLIPWRTALELIAGLGAVSTRTACGLVDGTNWRPGDWRLPTVNELKSLIDYRYFNPAVPNSSGGQCMPQDCPFEGVEGFVGNQGGAHWSSSTRIDVGTDNGAGVKAWAVKLQGGEVVAHFKYRRAKDGSAAPHYAYAWPVLSDSAVNRLGRRVVAAPAPVQATGQTACWPTDFEFNADHIPDASPVCCSGDTLQQDGSVRAGVPIVPSRFTVNLKADGRTEDGTVTDNLTGLVWVRFVDCFRTAPPPAVEGRMTWSVALTNVASLQDGGCDGRLRDESHAGDWRLPNIKELQTLVDFGRVPTLPAGLPFQDDDDDIRDFFTLIWSSTTVTQFKACAWSLRFTSGITHFNTARNGVCDPTNEKDGPAATRRGVWAVKGPMRN